MLLERGRGVSKEWGEPPSLLLQLWTYIGPAVDSQLLCRHNKQRPHKGQPAERSWAGRWQSRHSIPPPHPISPLSLQKQNCSSPSLLFIPSSFYLCLLPPSSLSIISILPLPSSMLSPASLEHIGSCLSLTRTKCTACKLSHCHVAEPNTDAVTVSKDKNAP